MQGGKNWFLPKEMNANRFFWDSHWLEIWSNHFYPSMGPNGGSVAMDSGCGNIGLKEDGTIIFVDQSNSSGSHNLFVMQKTRRMSDSGRKSQHYKGPEYLL